MAAPLYSTFALCTEIIITSLIFYVFYQGYVHNIFRKRVVVFALAYEVLFNISYMARRSPGVVSATSTIKILGAVHGILSLIMFITLIVFLVSAWKGYAKGNYFKKHRWMTFFFLLFWSFAIISGISLYLLAY